MISDTQKSVPGSKEAKRKRKSPKRIAVIEAAAEEFLSRGFPGTSMDRIAEAANVSKRTVYDHFPSKDILFQAIIDHCLEQIEDLPSCEYSKEKPLEKQLQEIGNIFAEAITDRTFMKLSRALIARFIQAPEWAHNTLKAHKRLRRDMIEFFKAGKKDKRLSIRDPERAATQFCGLIKEVVFWPELVAGQKPFTTRERRAVVKEAVSIFLSRYANE